MVAVYCKISLHSSPPVSVPEWAEKLTEMGKGRHHIGDFLPPAELEKFMETFTVGSALGSSCVAPCVSTSFRSLLFVR